MPIVSYSGEYALLATQVGGFLFAPAAGANPTLSGTGALFVWVGAQVQPATNQVAGV